jgi:hypothetical protein
VKPPAEAFIKYNLEGLKSEEQRWIEYYNLAANGEEPEPSYMEITHWPYRGFQLSEEVCSAVLLTLQGMRADLESFFEDWTQEDIQRLEELNQ